MRTIQIRSLLFLVISLLFLCANFRAQITDSTDYAALRAKALEIISQNRYLDALPLLERLAPMYPKDAEIWAHYGIAILTRSVTLTSPEERQPEQVKGYKTLLIARDLGTTNVKALDLLDQLSPNGENADNFSGDPEVEKNLREGEGFFGRGEYDKAFAAYERAFKHDPKNYEAVLFMGDSLYAAQKYKESELWFAKAVEVNPDREQAYRFWGDALFEQKKSNEAGQKFIDAFVSDPYSRLTLDRLSRWLDDTGTRTKIVEITPPECKSIGPISVNESLLNANDGTINWKVYNDVKKSKASGGGGSIRTLSGELVALKAVAKAARSDFATGKVKYPDHNLVSLIKLDDAGLLEPYILIVRSDENIAEEYVTYLKTNRSKIRQFVVEYLLGLPKQ